MISSVILLQNDTEKDKQLGSFDPLKYIGDVDKQGTSGSQATPEARGTHTHFPDDNLIQFPEEDTKANTRGATAQIVGDLTTRGKDRGIHTRFPDSDEEKDSDVTRKRGKGKPS